MFLPNHDNMNDCLPIFCLRTKTKNGYCALVVEFYTTLKYAKKLDFKLL